MSARKATAAAATAGGAGLGGVLGGTTAGPAIALLAAFLLGALVLVGMTLFWPSAVPFERLARLLRGGPPALAKKTALAKETPKTELALPKRKAPKTLTPGTGETPKTTASAARKSVAAKK